MSGLEGLVALAAVVLVIARQFLPRRISWKMMLAVPVALAYFAWRQLPGGHIPPGHDVELAVEIVLAVACGTFQASVAQVYARDGRWYIRGGWGYLAGWVVFFGGDVALHLIMEGPGAFSGGFSQGSTWVSLMGAAAAWAVRALVIALRHPDTLAPDGGRLGADRG